MLVIPVIGTITPDTAWTGWVLNYYSAIIGAYLKSLEKYPNPPAISLTDFKTSRP